MELVAADFLKYSVEETLRKYFRVIRSERREPDSKDMLIANVRSIFRVFSNGCRPI